MSWRAACDCAGGSGPRLWGHGSAVQGHRQRKAWRCCRLSRLGVGLKRRTAWCAVTPAVGSVALEALVDKRVDPVCSSCGSDCADSVPGGAGSKGALPTCSLLTAEWRRLAMAMRFPVVMRLRLLRCSLRTSTDMECIAAMVSVERSSEDWSGRAARARERGRPNTDYGLPLPLRLFSRVRSTLSRRSLQGSM